MTPRQQSWADAEEPHGRLVVVSDNPVSQALVRLAEVVGREVVLVADDEDGHAIVVTDPVPTGLESDAQLGVDSCPERAISAV